MTAPPRGRSTWWVLAGLLLLISGYFAYRDGLSGPFLMDDFDAIIPIAANQAQGASWIEALRQAPPHVRLRWVTNLTFLANQALPGSSMPPDAAAYRTGNLLVHFATAGAVFWLSLLLLPAFGRIAGRAWAGAMVAAGVFLLHPLLVSTVLYPVQRMAQLATLLAVLAVVSYIHWRRTLASASEFAHVAGIVRTALLVGLAFFAKENGVLAVLLIGVVELVAFRWPARGTPDRSRFEAGFGVLCAAPLVLAVVYVAVRWQVFSGGYGGRDFSLQERLLTQVHVLWSYLCQIVWPDPASMGLYRDDFPVTRSLDLSTALKASAFAVGIAGSLLMRHRWPAMALAVLWFFAAHAMESTIIALELVFEHRNYLALPGICVFAGWLAARLPRLPGATMAVLMLALLGWTTQQRAWDWGEYSRWLRAEADHHPRSRRASSDLVAHLVAKGDFPAARARVEHLRATFPDEAQPVIVALWLKCGDAPLFQQDIPHGGLEKLRTGLVTKDAFHIYMGIAGRKDAGQCAGITWETLAMAAATVARNPGLRDDPRAVAGWNRAHASALSKVEDWAGVARALQRAVAAQGSHPADWLTLMRATLEIGDAGGYARARIGLLDLMDGELGPLQPRFAALERAAALRFGQPEP